jgi:Endonuclease/Exonuclease/phosphatase family
MRACIRLSVIALLLLASGGSLSAWQIRIATWNLQNLGRAKAGLPPNGPLNQQLLDTYAQIISQYDIVVLQEILVDGTPLTIAIANRLALANYDCQTVSLPSGRAGRQERYGVCYATAQLTGTFDWMAQATAQAFVPPPRVPQQVWMRPPLVASFTYTPPPPGMPFHFALNINHTKPNYSAGARPQGTPPAAHNFDSTHYELWATEQNAAAGLAPLAVLGDLNADCHSYPPHWRGHDFTAGWNWYPANYGEKTNVAPAADCAYDRIILNTAFNNYYLGHGVHMLGINQMLNGFQVSDHYLVWVRVGDGLPVVPPALAVAVAVPAPSFIKRVQAALAGGGRIYVVAAAVTAAATAAALYITSYDKDVYFQGNRVIPLTDVRGAPTPVRLENGGFVTPPVWDAPVSGAYKLVLDVNGDGKYVKTDGDVANLDGQIDFLVSDSATAHGSVVTRGDNGQLRELFNEASAHNVYAEARMLPATSNVDVWVVSTKLLPATFPGWATAIQQGTLNLASVSAPVNVTAGPLMLGDVMPAQQKQTVTTGADGTLFAAVWRMPATLFEMAALTALPPPASYDFDGDICASLGLDEECDPCVAAPGSDDPNFRAACNVWPTFSDHYGHEFNVVIDVNRNGTLDAPDVVDTHDIGDISAWLAAHPVLDASANGNPAVGEWKEYLDAKLNLTVPLPPGNAWDAATSTASLNYFCAPSVAAARLPLLTEGSQVGFVILDQSEYLKSKTLAGGVLRYDDAVLDDATLAAGTSTCVIADTLTLENLTAPAPANTTIRARAIDLRGDLRAARGSTVCMAADNFALTVAAGLTAATFAAPNPFTAGAAVIFAAVGLSQSSACPQ